MQVCPVASTSGKFVSLDIHSRVAWVERLPREKKIPQGSMAYGPQAVAAAVDCPELTCHQLQTSIRLPAGRRMLVGGMTCPLEPAFGAPNLYLFVKVTVQELRDDVVGRKMESKPGQMPASPTKR